MSFQMHDLETAMARLREQGERIREFQAETAARTTTVHSKDRMVSVTVGGRGRLTELVIKGNRHRSMPPAELASVVMETVNAALEQASTEAMRAARALMPGGLEPDGLSPDGNIDMAGFMDGALSRLDDPTPRSPGGGTAAGT
ncbi:YbaB/EbfC family nucleoid-associated protein [Solwaraspora sp. WMMB335]|uniref:YbaB/EbfC family nucleoid-associated protein n=1 Tax=Solwaraspora sp. WMMB335 TaxID=3404118 RepID=UPI003B954E63